MPVMTSKIIDDQIKDTFQQVWYVVDPTGLTHWQFLPLSTDIQKEGVTGPIGKEG
jgi:hypothetical protein